MWPLPMAAFGLNPFGGNLYRIVLADSRREITCGDWKGAGVPYAEWTLKYPAYKDKGIWVMEKWEPGEYFGSPEKWPDVNGPYPARGDYEFCHGFEAGTPDDANLPMLLDLLEKSRNIPVYRRMIAIRNLEEQRKQTMAKMIRDMIRDKLPAYGCRPMFSGGGGKTTIRGTKNDHGPRPRRTLSTQDIRMPSTPGAAVVRRGKLKLPKPEGVIVSS